MQRYDLSLLSMLVVEDEPHMQDLVCGILRTLGIRKVQRRSVAKEALDLLAVTEIDIIITDWDMEPLSGVGFIRRLRRMDDSPSRIAPVIMLTARTSRKDIREARDAGINEYLVKPVAPNTLYERIVAIVENPRDFIIASEYVGPDRRRNEREFNGGERRGQTRDATG